MEDQRVAEYFVIGGLTPNPVPLSQFSCEGAPLKSSHSQFPITDIAIVNKTIGETVPDDYICLSVTPSGLSANLNSGVIRANEIFLCFRRGRDKPPLFDIGVLLEGRDRLLADSQVLEFTVASHNANINANGVSMYMTYRRSTETTACNELVVSDICVIMANKGESAPHSYCTIERNLNKGTMVGSDIYVCYKKSVNHTNYIAYKPGILDKYPMKSRPSFPLPADLSLFCLPMGATLEAWPPQATKPEPVFSTFVLTVSRTSTGGNDPVEGVDKVYGAAITFYERYCHKKLTSEQFQDLKLNDHFGSRNVVHTNKCICILSMWPFFDTFDKFLRYLLEVGNISNSRVPIERYIWHMLDCVPFPSSRRPRILIQLDAKNGISLVQPEDSPIPLSGASFRKLVMNLHPEGCLQVLMFALTEQKILLHSLRPFVLTSVAEAISSIIFPFHWQCPYIPLCPLGLSDILEAPIPFLIGLDSRFFDLYDPPPDIICIDLDTAAMSVPEDKKYLSAKMFPKKAARILKSSLDALCASIKDVDSRLENHRRSAENQFSQMSEADFKMIRQEQELEIAIQETFLKFMATILKGYSQYLLPIVAMNSPDTVALFDGEAYVKSRDRSHQKFYETITGTQMFSKFIEERTFVSNKNASLVFFDDCIEKLNDDDAGSKFLEIEAISSQHTLFLPPPEPPSNASSAGYSYKSFSTLNPALFPNKAISTEMTESSKNSSTLGIPGSPLARRSKHEVKSAQKLASKHYQTPMLWAKCLLATSFSVWFAHLPSFVTQNQFKSNVLDLAFNVLQRMQKLSLSHQDEVCYRVMMQLCGVYSKPVLAVKTLCEMKNAGITPNAITYGYYNRALLESKWNQSHLLWSKLRNVIKGVTAFRQGGTRRAERRYSSCIDETDKVSGADVDSSSRISTDSSTSDQRLSQFKCDTLNSDPGYCSINDNVEQNAAASSYSCDITPSAPAAASELLINGLGDASVTNNMAVSGTEYSNRSASDSTANRGQSMTSRCVALIAQAGNSTMNQPTDKDNISFVKASLDRVVTSSCDASKAKISRPVVLRSGPRKLDFSQSDEFRQRTGCIVRSTAVGLSCGIDLSLLETRPLLVSSAGLLMTSPMNAKTLSGDRDVIDRKSDLADALSPTLLKYDQIKEPSAPMNFESTPEKYSENSNSGREDTIAKRLFNFVIPPFDDEVQHQLDIPEKVSNTVNKTPPYVTGESNTKDRQDNLNDIEEEADTPSNTPFFQRNTSQRLSNLWKKGIGGANGKIRVFWMKNSPKRKINVPGKVKLPLKSTETEIQAEENNQLPEDSLVQRDNTESDEDDTSKNNKSPSQLLISSERTGRQIVICGDPLGATSLQTKDHKNNYHSRKDSSVSLGNPSKTKVQISEDNPSYERRTNTFTSRSISASDSQLKQRSISFNPPFSSEGFNSLPPGVSLSGSDDSNQDSNSLHSWVPPFKNPLSGTVTYGLASSLASQGIRQATKHIESLRTTYGDTTITEWASPTNFNYRRSINSMKSAVTSFSRKYNEIKESFSTAPPTNIEEGEDDIDGFWNFGRTVKDVSYDTEAIAEQSTINDFQTSWIPSGPYCLGIWLTSCSKCRSCKKILFDEEIMSGWSPDDNNLNTKCWHCNNGTLPLLSIDLFYLRHICKTECFSDNHAAENTDQESPKENTGQQEESDAFSYIQKKGEKLDRFTVPYLSPLVLRKELETMLGHDGDSCLTELTLLNNHPILYWNMVWYFSRLRLPTHLVGLCLHSHLLNEKRSHDSWAGADWKNVYVRCMWDNQAFHLELGMPLYVQWKENFQTSCLVEALTPHTPKVSKDVLQSFLTLIHYNKIGRCLEIILQELKKQPAELNNNHYPIYRDLLFFAYTTIPYRSLNVAAFEPEFRREFDRLFHENRKLIQAADGPPSVASIFCKRYFHHLSL